MATIRTDKRINYYAQVDKRLLEDESISWKAKGLLAYLLSRPDDWQVYVSQLATVSEDGETATRSGITELIEAGYITKERERNEDGTIAGVVYTVREHRTESPNTADASTSGQPQSGQPQSGQSQSGKAGTTNKESSKKESSKKDNKSASDSAQDKTPNGNEVPSEEGTPIDEAQAIWEDVCDVKPDAATAMTLQGSLATCDVEWQPPAFRKAVKTAYRNVNLDAGRIRVGYLMDSYEREAARMEDKANPASYDVADNSALDRLEDRWGN